MDEFKINTAQNVTINQNVALVTSRISAFLIDAFIIAAYYILLFILLNYLGLSDFEELNMMYLIASLPVFFYHLLFEVLMNGQTPGKYWVKIRVIKVDGSKPTFSSFILRWVLRIIDITISGGSLALLCLIFNRKGQRIGDMAAGTTVISEKQKIGLTDTILEDLDENYIPTFPQVTVLSDRDVQNIKMLFKESIASGNHSAILKLSNKIKELTNISSDLLPIDFINTVLKDYNYYTQKM